MTVSELRNALYRVVSDYFQGASVIWAEQKAVKPSVPLIKLKLFNFVSTQNYINQEISGKYVAIMPFYAHLEVQLFTHGEKNTDDEGNVYYVNSAVSDLIAFSHYLKSDYATEFLDTHNISIRTEGNVDDVSAVVDATYEYRAVQQYVVNFLSETEGKAGIILHESGEKVEPTASGGGTQELVEMEIGEFESVVIKEEYH